MSGLRLQDGYRVIQLADKTELNSRALIIASGVQYRKLDVPGVDELTGAGVFYGAAITEATAVRDQDVFVVGGGNSAGQASVYLARFARTVTLLVRGDSLSATMSQYLIDQIAATPNIQVRTNAGVVGVEGQERLEVIRLASLKTGEAQTVPAAGMFIFIGAVPRTEWVAGLVERDSYGFILTGPDLVREGRRPRTWTLSRDPYWLEASVPGIFVAGDVRHRSIKRVASAVGEGGMAVAFVHQYLAGL